MGMFANLDTGNMEQQDDTLGGGFEPVPSDVYAGTIALAYVGKSKSSNAQSITFHVKLEGGKEHRETVWFTNGKGETFFMDKEDKNKRNPLPGFTLVNDMCLMATGLPLTDMNTEEKVVKLYDFTERKELPKPVDVLVDLLGQPIKLGLLRQIVDKQKKNESTGNYENTGETRTENAIDKVFHAETDRTAAECLRGQEVADFMPKWLERNKGNDRNKAKGASNAGAGTQGQGRPGAAAGGQRKSLF